MSNVIVVCCHDNLETLRAPPTAYFRAARVSCDDVSKQATDLAARTFDARHLTQRPE